MNKETSIYLDAVRFLAALTVFVSHLSSQQLTGGLMWPLTHLGDQAVTVFFVLSGFVIGYVTEMRERDLRAYAVNRAARILSVALPALALTFLLDRIGLAHDPELYLRHPSFLNPPAAVQYIASALFLNEVWGLNISPGSNLAYWSLGYEVWYYVIYGAALFTPRRYRTAASIATAVLAGPAIVLLLPLWLAGVGLYRLCTFAPASRAVGWALFASSILLWGCYEVWSATQGPLSVTTCFLQPRAQIPQDYLIAGLFAMNLYGFHAISNNFNSVLLPVGRAIQWMAGATFTLYLIHQPVLHMLVALSPWPADSWQNRTLAVLGTVAFVFAFASLTERRKDSWRRMIDKFVGRQARWT